MRTIVVGAGRVGYGIAAELASQRSAVTVVDVSPALIEQVTTDLDVRGVVGNGAWPRVLEQAGAAEAELIIAATYADEVNMVACQVAHSVFNVPTKMARVRAQEYLDPRWRDLFSRNNVPIDVVISPEAEVARAIFRRLETPGAFDTMAFSDGKVLVLGIRLDDDCPVLATPLAQLSELFPTLKARVTAVRRDRRMFVPRKSDQLLSGDEIYIVVPADQAERALDIFGRASDRARRVVIVGAGNIGVFLAREIEKLSGVRVRIVEADKARAERAAGLLQRTVVLHGDGLDPTLLREAGVTDSELLVALTNDDKVNVLSAALGKKEGVASTLALINDPTYRALKRAFGVDIFVDPRASTISTILQHVRKGRITGLRTLAEGDGEFVEGEALDTSPLVGKPLKKVGLGDGIAAGAVVRNGETLIPSGDFEVAAGDRVVLFAQRSEIGRVEKLFRVALEYF